MAKYIAREKGQIPGKYIDVGETFEWDGKPPRWADPVPDETPEPKHGAGDVVRHGKDKRHK